MILPMIAMVFLTFVIMYFTVTARFRAVAKGTVDGRYFSLMQGEGVPDDIIKTTRNFNNLFEMPVLFYVAAVIVHFSETATMVSIGLAWAFVASRALHSYIHLTSNDVRKRLRVFGLSNIFVFGMWVELGLTQL